MLTDQITKMGAPAGPGEDGSGRICVRFGPLFIAYQDISDTLVGIMMRAKKRKLIEYKGDMLFQGCHNNVVIYLN